jgi:endoglucanase
MKLRSLVIEGWLVAGLLLAGCNQSDSSVAQGPTTEKAAPPPQAAKTVETPKPAVPAAAAPAPAPKFSLRVDCGASAPYTDKLGNTWVADQELAPDKTWGSDDGSTMDREGVGITGTDMARIYETERYSMGSYKFTVPNGKYTVRLHFAETFEGISGPGERVFSVKVAGQEVLKDLDPFKAAGGALKPVVKEFKGVSVENGQLVIDFTANVENPQICGIEILGE